MTIADLLDAELDGITQRSFPTLWARFLIGGVAAVFVLLNRGEALALCWIAACFAAEALMWRACRPQRSDRPSTVQEKLLYVSALAFMNVTWAGLGAAFRTVGSPAMVVAGGLVMASQVVHAVVFAARSPIAFSCIAAPPTAMLVTLIAMRLGGSWLEHVTAGFAALIFVGYSVLASRAGPKRSVSEPPAHRPHRVAVPTLAEVKAAVSDFAP